LGSIAQILTVCKFSSVRLNAPEGIESRM
jgi:hypothetical protein